MRKEALDAPLNAQVRTTEIPAADLSAGEGSAAREGARKGVLTC
jgi:hypothetical protein